MRTRLEATILLVAMLAVTAFGQGKVRLQNNSGCVIQLTGFPGGLFAQDAALAGQPIPTTGPLPSGIVLVAGLYAGTSTASLALVEAGWAGSSLSG
jgi:hypothetical protein